MDHEDRPTGGGAVLRFLEARTAPHVFGVPGSSSVPIFHEFRHSKLTLVPAIQENAAVATADGYARFAGPTGVLLYMMPGAATALGNVYNSYRDETPLVLIISQQSTHARWGQVSVGEADIAELMRPITRFAREVSEPTQLLPMLEAAYRAASGPPGGPAVVVVPEDLVRAEIGDLPGFGEHLRDRSAAADVSVVADRLAASVRPLIVVGGQVRRTGGSAAVEQLAAANHIPVMYEPFWNDRLGVSAAHANVLGQVTENSSAVTEADFVLAIGCRLFNEVHPLRRPWFAPEAFVAHVHADAARLEETFGASWSCAADPAVVATQLNEAMTNRVTRNEVLAERRVRLDALVGRRKRRRQGPYSDATLAIVDSIGAGYLVDESVQGNAPFISAAANLDASGYVSTTGGSLGWAPGAAAGIALATGARVTCALGDGAFFFGLQGFWAATSLALPVTFVVLDNGGFGSTRWFERQYAQTFGDAERAQPVYGGSDFAGHGGRSVVEVARGLGVPAEDVTVADLPDALAVKADGPVLYRVPIDS